MTRFHGRRRGGVGRGSLALLLLGFCLGVRDGEAQGRRLPATARTAAARDAERVKIRRLEGTGNEGRVRTPEYSTNVSRGRTPAREWLRVRTTYDTEPEWIDELQFRYTVLLLKVEKSKKTYTMLKGTVSYTDIPDGKRHMSEMYLRPNPLERYGDCVGLVVEVLEKGEVIALERDEKLNFPERWWEQKENITVLDGYLLSRPQTPFAFINVDDYEDIK